MKAGGAKRAPRLFCSYSSARQVRTRTQHCNVARPSGALSTSLESEVAKSIGEVQDDVAAQHVRRIVFYIELSDGPGNVGVLI